MHLLKALTKAAPLSLWFTQAPFITHDEQAIITGGETSSSHLPVVVWHGMGDYYNSESMQRVNETLKTAIPGIHIYFVKVKEDSLEDQEASITGDAMTQVQEVCEQLRNISGLDKGFNAVGFSQGGLFLRAAMQMCGLPIHNLVTFGSPHYGIADLPVCETWLCERRNELLKQHLYDERIQNSIIQAQYYRDVTRYDEYIEKSVFLKYINNEFIYDPSYSENLAKLHKLVMVMFTQDKTVVPKESAWFYDLDPKTGETIPFQDTDAYILLGLQSLDAENAIDFLKIDAEHMRITDSELIDITKKYL